MPRRIPRFRPAAEALEGRSCPSVAIQIDYSLDADHFFDDPTRRSLLQLAADSIGAELNDPLSAIIPSASNSWTATVTDPSTGGTLSLANPAVPADTILVFAGGRSLAGGGELGVGGPGGYSDSGSPAWLDLIAGRGRAGVSALNPLKFVPWGGSVAFDTGADWYFGSDASKLGADQNDFLTVASHELLHLLGFGTSAPWSLLAATGTFLGPHARAADGGAFPAVSPDGGHWAQGTTSGGFPTVMEPSIVVGARDLPTRLDYAGLQDIGWDLATDPGSTIPQATDETALALGDGAIAGQSIGPSATDVAMYGVTGRAGDLLTVATLRNPAEATVATDLRLFDASGHELKALDAGLAGSFRFALPADGTYYLGVSGEGNAAYSSLDDAARRLAGPTGQFTLALRLDPPSGGTAADLAVAIAGPAQGVAGDRLDYGATVVDNGPDAAGSVLLTVAIPASMTLLEVVPSQGTASLASGVLTVDFGALAPGGSATLRFAASASSASPLTLSASVSSTLGDPSPANNSAAIATAVSPAPTPPPSVTLKPAFAGFQVLTSGKGAKKTSRIVLMFNKPLDPASVSPSAFALTRPKPGPRRRGQAAIRLAVGIKAASYEPATPLVVTLDPAIKGALPRGLILTLSPGIRDLSANDLTGAMQVTVS